MSAASARAVAAQSTDSVDNTQLSDDRKITVTVHAIDQYRQRLNDTRQRRDIQVEIIRQVRDGERAGNVLSHKPDRRVGLDLSRIRPEALLFPQDRRNALRAVYAAGDAAGLNPEGVEKVGLHDLRHSCAGLLFAANVPAPTIAAILRHADVRTTLTVYAGLVETNRAALRGELETAFQAST